MKDLIEIYSEIALEREHICTGCGTKHRLSHSHLIPRGDKEFRCDKRNIQYHCLSIGETKGCHQKWESVDFWQLNDAEANMRFVYSVRPHIFWLKINHAIDAYEKRKALATTEKQDLAASKALHILYNLKSIADA